jgi:hypothetical protein
LADVVPSDRLPFYMVFREASATMAFIIGPIVGGILTLDRVTKVLDRVLTGKTGKRQMGLRQQLLDRMSLHQNDQLFASQVFKASI